MGKIALTVLGWTASKLGLLIFTLLVFIAGTYLNSEFDRHDQVLKEMQRGIQVVGDTAPDKVVKSLTNILGGELPSAQTALGEISQARAKLQAARKDKKIERDKVERDASIVELKLPVSGPSLQRMQPAKSG